MSVPNINAIPDLTLLTTKILEFIEFEEKEETKKLKENNRGYYNNLIDTNYTILTPTMVKLLSDINNRTENLEKMMDMIRLLRNIKEGRNTFENAENEFMEKRSEEYLYPIFGGREKFYKIAEENKKNKENKQK